jgi:tRNA pseudouridine38-40 synthase
MHAKLTVEYVGTKFFGFQSQAGRRTAQGELESAISKYFGCPVKTVGAGRTDAGVHAVGQVISFLLPDGIVADIKEKDGGKFLYRMAAGINSFLPADISVKSPELKDKFNARSDAKSKTYIYKCYVNEHRCAAREATRCQIYSQPNIAKLREAAKYFVGEHNFAAFCGELGDKNPSRTIYEFNIDCRDDEIWFTVRGVSFLKNMVRIMVGTLLEVGGRFAPDDIKKILDSRDRKNAGKTAAAKGLTLYRVEY